MPPTCDQCGAAIRFEEISGVDPRRLVPVDPRRVAVVTAAGEIVGGYVVHGCKTKPIRSDGEALRALAREAAAAAPRCNNRYPWFNGRRYPPCVDQPMVPVWQETSSGTRLALRCSRCGAFATWLPINTANRAWADMHLAGQL